MSAQVYRRVLQGGLIASLFIVFFVFQDLLFPYITSKQLSFNILMEFLFAVWLVFILRYPEYRPRRSYITIGLLVFFLAILASCAVSVDIGLSFWGDAERMLGLFHILHFFIFYLILVTVFRSWAEWRALFLASVIVATLVSLVGIFGQNIYSTLGNTTYVSGYIIFNLFFALILFGRSENRSWRWLYVLPAVIMLYEFWLCRTSGAIIGLFVSLLLLFFLLGLFHKQKIWRRTALASSLAAVLIIAAVFSQQQTAWFQSSFLRNLTFQKNTFQTRLLSWRAAADDFHNHWLFGTGFGNYAIIFDQYFDSHFFNYSRSESYFDRAHNNLIDIASTSGLVGLLTYLSIFAAALYYLRRSFKRNGPYAGTDDLAGRRNLEIIIILSLIAAYFIQNLVVFDSYVTYISLMIILGFIYWQAAPSAAAEAAAAPARRLFIVSRQWEGIVLVIFILGAYIFASQYNLKPWRMFQGVINGYSNILGGKFATGVLTYQAALVAGVPLEHDGRVTLINLVTANPTLLDSVPKEGANAVLEYVIGLAEDNVNDNPRDSLMQMQLAQILDTAARFNYKDTDKFNDYSGRALQAMERSIAASPGRAPLYLIRAQMLLFRGENDEAIKNAQYAISLNPQYSEPYCRLAQFYLLLKDETKMADPLNQCLDLGGVSDMNSSQLVEKFVNYYVDQKDYPRIIKLAERLSQLNADNAQVWFSLAKIYWATGDKDKASTTVATAIGLDPKLVADWQTFLDSMKSLPVTPAK
jgi:O-antigen ligase/Flp pilus assembly protein TadD